MLQPVKWIELPNVGLRPPRPPTNFGSMSWCQTKLDTEIKAEFAFRKASVVAHKQEMEDLNSNKLNVILNPNVELLSNLCITCSSKTSRVHETQTIIGHTHVSTLVSRCKTTLDTWGQFSCQNCKASPHYIVTADKYYILVTSSCLNRWRGEEYEGDAMHIEEIGIPGAEILDLLHAVTAEYGNTKKDLNIVLCTGLNNLMRGQSVDNIIADFALFKQVIESWSQGNSVGIATLFCPPALWHRREEIRSINNFILNMNQEGANPQKTYLTPQFHAWGTRRGRPLYSQYRENRIIHKMHLKDSIRTKMGRAVVRYFSRISTIADMIPEEESEEVDEQQQHLHQASVLHQAVDEHPTDGHHTNGHPEFQKEAQESFVQTQQEDSNREVNHIINSDDEEETASEASMELVREVDEFIRSLDSSSKQKSNK